MTNWLVDFNNGNEIFELWLNIKFKHLIMEILENLQLNFSKKPN